jgi:hypothetical protein
MALHHRKEKQTSGLQTVIIARLSDFVRELTAMIETYGTWFAHGR